MTCRTFVSYMYRYTYEDQSVVCFASLHLTRDVYIVSSAYMGVIIECRKSFTSPGYVMSFTRDSSTDYAFVFFLLRGTSWGSQESQLGYTEIKKYQGRTKIE